MKNELKMSWRGKLQTVYGKTIHPLVYRVKVWRARKRLGMPFKFSILSDKSQLEKL